MGYSSRAFMTLALLLTACSYGLGCKDEPVTDDVAGSTVKMEVLPESIHELITDEITLTCTPKDLPQGTKGILFMELGKEGEHPLVALKGSELELGTEMKQNMRARGNIADNASESFLHLTIKRPFVDDVNVYCCRMFYQDKFGELKMGHVYADVSVENNDKAVIVHLLTKVSDLESTLVQHQNDTKTLEANLLEQRQLTEDLETKVKEQEKKLSDKEKDSFTSAFSAYGTEKLFNTGDTFTCKHSLFNIGGDYNLSTGVYTAPRKGLYVFHIFERNKVDNEIKLDLKVNEVTMASLYAYDDDRSDQSSVSTVLSLDRGDKVRPVVTNGNVKPNSDDEHYNGFNGYLLKLL